MSSAKRMGWHFSGWRQPVISAALAVMAGGCSADVSRFEFPASLSLNDSSGATGTIPAPTEPSQERSSLIGAEGSNGAGGQAYYPPPSPTRPESGVSVSALPDATPPQPTPSYSAPQQQSPSWPVESRAPATPHAVAPVAALSPTAPATQALSSDRGEMIEVRPGDTLYGLSKRHRVSLNELMSVNDLKGPNLKPGQKLYLPAGRAAPVDTRSAESVAAAPPIDAPADWTGSYVVRPGESLYAIARQNGIKPADLQRYNGITDVRRMKPGTVLRMPAGAGQQVAANTQAPTQTDAAPIADPAAPRVVQVPSQPTILNSAPPAPVAPVAPNPREPGKQVVAVNTPTSASQQSEAGKLRWPAQGKVISGFGPRPDGTHNDGVNLSVPMGTEIHAAEGGVVAYAGNELKGYGNLILLRHDNGWVTAYAHSEELLVKRGDKVRRGQIIAKAGKTGQVDQPQVHFELRQGQRPVDPTPYMEKL